MVRNNDLEDKMHLLESADEWPFLKEMLAGEGAGSEEAGGGKQEHLLCDALIGEPFYYRVRTQSGYLTNFTQLTAVVARLRLKHGPLGTRWPCPVAPLSSPPSAAFVASSVGFADAVSGAV